MMMAAYVTRGQRKARIFSDTPLPDLEQLDALLDAEMDETESARHGRLKDILSGGFARAVVYPGDMTLPDVLFAYVVGTHGEHVFACVVVTERRIQAMLCEAPVVVEGFTLQVAQGEDDTGAEVEAALATWAGRNFADLPPVGFEVERWLEPPPQLPEYWDLDASVADPPYQAAA